LFALVVYVIAAEASGFIAQLIAFMPRLKVLAIKDAAELGLQSPQTAAQLLSQLNLAHYVSMTASAFRDMVQGATLVLIYLVFLFIARGGFDQKASLLFERAAS